MDLLDTALPSARVLRRAREGHPAQSDSPTHRQVLERALKQTTKQQPIRRLSQISLTGSNQNSLLVETTNQPQEEPLQVSKSSPRTSSPFDPNFVHQLAPLSPTTPSSSFDSVFFPDSSVPLAPIGETILSIPQNSDIAPSESINPTEGLTEGLAMVDLVEEEKNLKSLVRKINAKINSTPVSLLTDAEVIPEFKRKQDELVQLLEDLDLGITGVCEDYEAQMGQTKINSWTTALGETRSKVIDYKQSVLTEIKKLREPPSGGAVISTQPSLTSTLNSSVEQERLSFDKEKQRKQEERIRAEADTRCKTLTEDITRFAKRFH